MGVFDAITDAIVTVVEAVVNGAGNIVKELAGVDAGTIIVVIVVLAGVFYVYKKFQENQSAKK